MVTGRIRVVGWCCQSLVHLGSTSYSQSAHILLLNKNVGPEEIEKAVVLSESKEWSDWEYRVLP